MRAVRIGAPGGEAVIECDSIHARQLFDLVASFGWFVEERRPSDRVLRGWIGEPIRQANMKD